MEDKKLVWGWNNMRALKSQQNLNFGVNNFFN